jgi:hypothetical protein
MSFGSLGAAPIADLPLEVTIHCGSASCSRYRHHNDTTVLGKSIDAMQGVHHEAGDVDVKR